jgi:hypothetical protein
VKIFAVILEFDIVWFILRVQSFLYMQSRVNFQAQWSGSKN